MDVFHLAWARSVWILAGKSQQDGKEVLTRQRLLLKRQKLELSLTSTIQCNERGALVAYDSCLARLFAVWPFPLHAAGSQSLTKG